LGFGAWELSWCGVHLGAGGLDGEAVGGHAAGVMFHLNMLPAGAAQLWPGLVTAAIAAGLGRAGRRRPWVMAAACAAAAAVGWEMLAPWSAVLWPRGAAEHLVLPALVLAAAGIASRSIRSAWLGRAAVAFGGWWLAASAAGRPEFWRVWFGACVVTWALGRAGAASPARAAAAVLSVWGAFALAGASSGVLAVWLGAGLVAAGAVAGVSASGRVGIVPPGLLMVFIVGADIGLGRSMRGEAGLVDLACAGAVAAPWLSGWFERRFGRRLGAPASVVAPVAAAACVIAAAWLGVRVMRGH
jgi:hypothetical protein